MTYTRKCAKPMLIIGLSLFAAGIVGGICLAKTEALAAVFMAVIILSMPIATWGLVLHGSRLTVDEMGIVIPQCFIMFKIHDGKRYPYISTHKLKRTRLTYDQMLSYGYESITLWSKHTKEMFIITGKDDLIYRLEFPDKEGIAEEHLIKALDAHGVPKV